jgi:hypothetical protein
MTNAPEEHMVPEAQHIADLIAEERARFERFCRSLTAEELGRPVPESTWQVRDFIAHLATIDRPVAAWFAEIQGEPRRDGREGARWTVDTFNDSAVAERRGRSLDDLFAEAARERAALVDVLGRFTEEQLASTVRFGGDSKRPPTDLQVGRYLQGWARHDIIHVADMLKALPERRTGPPIVEWLSDPTAQAVIGMYQRAMA